MVIGYALKTKDEIRNEQKGTTSNWNARLKAMQELQKKRKEGS